MAIMLTEGPIVEKNKELQQAYIAEDREAIERIEAERSQMLDKLLKAEDTISAAEELIQQAAEATPETASSVQTLANQIVKQLRLDNDNLRQLLRQNINNKRKVNEIILKLRELKKEVQT